MRPWVSSGLASLIGGMALAQEPDNRAIPGEVIVEPPTLNALGVEWRITGDANRNASVALEYRKRGDADWRRGAPLLRLNGEQVQQGASYHYTAPNMFAGSVFDLAPATTYELRLTLSDPDIQNAAPIQRTTTAKRSSTATVPRYCLT